MKKLHHYGLAMTMVACLGLAHAQVNVTATVASKDTGKKGKSSNPQVVLWLTPLDAAAVGARVQPAQHPALVQTNKSFQPHILVIPVGTQVQFPNRDPFFHNVFSLFEGKRFDLGLYEAGSSRDVLFDKPGISYIFCNIHAEMSAVVIALSTPYYGISDRKGQIMIPRVPAGRYTLHEWYETATPEALTAMTREVNVGEATANLGELHISAPGIVPAHKNMYGKDYPPPKPGDPPYSKP